MNTVTLFEMNYRFEGAQENSFLHHSKSSTPTSDIENGMGNTQKCLFIGCKDTLEPSASFIDLDHTALYEMRKMKKYTENSYKNMQFTLKYAIDQLGIKQIIVCGHYYCHELKQSTTEKAIVLQKEYKSIKERNADELALIISEDERHKRIVEISVIEKCKLISKALCKIMPKKVDDILISGWVYDSRSASMIDMEYGVEAYGLATIAV